MHRLLATKDFLSGLFLVVVGGIALYLAQGYGLGTVRGPGPGFFPMLVGGCLVIFGAGLMVNAVANPRDATPVGSWQIRPALFILTSVVVFAFLMRYGHFFLAIVALVFISSLSRGRLMLRELAEVALMSIVLFAISAGVFVLGLGMPFSLSIW